MQEQKKIISIKNDQEPQQIYIGSYSESMARPSIYQFLPTKLLTQQLLPPFTNPSYIYHHKTNNRNIMYAVEETQNGNLVVFDLDRYEVLQRVRTFGDDPCHICMNQGRNLLVVTNYTSGSFVVYKIGRDGLIEEGMEMFVMHEGSGPNVDRQASAHPHSSIFVEKDQQNEREIDEILLVADLGTDTIYYYTIANNYTTIKCQSQKNLKLPGAGPRHMTRGPKNSKIVFVCGQLDSSLRILKYSTQKIQLVSGYKVSNNFSNYPSEILYKPNTNLLYLACRGDNYLIVFDFIQQSYNEGVVLQLKEKFRFKVGQWPRHFNVSEGNTVYVACQFKNVVQRFRVAEEGKVYQLGSLKIACPSCICFKV